jgi:N-acetylglucosamine-6-phosphate deacetylase
VGTIASMGEQSLRAVFGGTIVAATGVHSPGVVLMRGGRIIAVGDADDVAVPGDADLIDASGTSVVPGFIDLHVHGLLNHDAMGPGLREVTASLPAYGVTGFLATTVTRPEDETLDALETMARIIRCPPRGARCLGIHLEGPFLAPSRAGMAAAELFGPPSWPCVERWLRAADGQVRLLTLAPELPGSLELISRLVERGVLPSVGHSDASFDVVGEAVSRGLRHATHTFNAMRPLHHREPGVVGGVLYHDCVTAELIADGVHVHPAVIDLVLQLKGLQGVALVSDAAPQAGLAEGAYRWSDQTIHVSDGSCRLADGTIAGAHALLDAGVRTLVQVLGRPLEQAVVPATTVPARELGLRTGRLAEGYDADLVLLDRCLVPVRTFVLGEQVYRRGE